jgi:flagellar protein FliO/FliZ
MKPGLFSCAVLALACGMANAAEPAAAPAASAAVSAPNADLAPATPAVAVAPPLPAAAPAAVPAAVASASAAPMPLASSSSAGSLLQTIAALVFVLALLLGLAWFLKRYGPKPVGGNAQLRLLSTLSLGGRERIMLIEVADQWIVVGASPGRLNALATMPRQDSELALPPTPQNGLAAANFSEWLKQTIEKRNGK